MSSNDEKKQRLIKLIEDYGFNSVLQITGYSGSTLGMYADEKSTHCIPEYKLDLAERKLCEAR